MLSVKSSIGSLVNFNAYILSRSKVWTTSTGGNRTEVIAVTSEGLLLRVSVWGLVIAIEPKGWMSFSKFRVNFYRTFKTISSMDSSRIEPISSTNPIPIITDTFGDIVFDSINGLRSKSSVDKPSYSMAKGIVSGHDHRLFYIACSQCSRRWNEESLSCSSPQCPSTRSVRALKVTVFVTDLDEQSCEPITLFAEALQSLLGLDLSIVDEDVMAQIDGKLLDLQSKIIGFKVKIESKVMIGSENQKKYYTALNPVFLMSSIR